MDLHALRFKILDCESFRTCSIFLFTINKYTYRTYEKMSPFSDFFLWIKH